MGGYKIVDGQPVGHLSEIGFFVPDMEKTLQDLEPKGWEVASAIEVDGARMYKVINSQTPGISVELIDYETDK